MDEIVCDKCGKEVATHDDAIILQARLVGLPWLTLAFRPRHIRCAPGRAQFIMAPEFGEPVVEERPEYDKRLMTDAHRSALEQAYTQVWREMQS